MAARRAYLDTAIALRAGVARPRPQRHTHLTERLRRGVIESEIMMQARLADMQARSSVYGNPRADLDDAGETMYRRLMDAMSSVPYITGGKSGEDSIREDRMRAVERYRRYVELATGKAGEQYAE